MSFHKTVGIQIHGASGLAGLKRKVTFPRPESDPFQTATLRRWSIPPVKARLRRYHGPVKSVLPIDLQHRSRRVPRPPLMRRRQRSMSIPINVLAKLLLLILYSPTAIFCHAPPKPIVRGRAWMPVLLRPFSDIPA